MTIKEELEVTQRTLPIHKVVQTKYVLKGDKVVIGLSHISKDLNLSQLKDTLEKKNKKLCVYLQNPYKKINGVTYKEHLNSLGIGLYKEERHGQG